MQTCLQKFGTFDIATGSGSETLDRPHRGGSPAILMLDEGQFQLDLDRMMPWEGGFYLPNNVSPK